MKTKILRLFPGLRELTISEDLLTPSNVQKSGGQRSFIAKSDAVDCLLVQKYGRDGLCFKMFRPKFVNTKSPRWEGTHIVECTKIQNLFALEKMAPRVYDLVLINNKCLAQVTDYIEPNGEIDRNEFARIMKKYNFGPVEPSRHRWKMPSHNYVGSQLVDFGGLHFLDRRGYQKEMIERTYYPNHQKPYQPIKELSIEGMRDIARRADIMRLDEVDFHGKSVLDLGCNIGAFCREAKDRGARRVVGVDKEKAIAALELSNWLCYWDIDYLELSLPGGYPEIQGRTGVAQFDIVFCLAISEHAGGIGQRMADVSRDLLLFEGHRNPREKYEPSLRKHFNTVAFLGYTHDMGQRPVFRCRKT